MAENEVTEGEMPTVHIEVVSDVVCPWCYIGKRRLEGAIALTPDVNVEVNFRPYFLNPWIPREGIDRQVYLETKFGSAPVCWRPRPPNVVAPPQRQWKAWSTIRKR